MTIKDTTTTIGRDAPLRIAIDANMSAHTPTDSMSSVADISEQADLPAGWAEQHTATGCPYYTNEDTNITTWIDPRRILQSN